MKQGGATCPCAGRARVDAYFDVPGVRALLERHGAAPADAAAIRALVELEWELFDEVEGLEGRASCQDDARSFFMYRLAQYLAFPAEFAHRALADARSLRAAHRNPVLEKYARMMSVTDPDCYRATWARTLPAVSPVRACALCELADACAPFASAASAAAPVASAHARVATSRPREVSGLDYFLCEVAPYSLRTIWYLRDAMRELAAQGGNPIVDAYALACAIDQVAGV